MVRYLSTDIATVYSLKCGFLQPICLIMYRLLFFIHRRYIAKVVIVFRFLRGLRPNLTIYLIFCRINVQEDENIQLVEGKT